MRRSPLLRLLAATLSVAAAAAPVLAAAVALVPAARAFAGDVEEGKRWLEDRQWQRAADAFRAALKESPSSRDAALGLATAAAEGKIADAYDAATAATSTALKANKDDRELRLAYGYLFLARASVDERWRADAQEQFQRLLKANPDDADATIGLARYYYFGGDYPRGLELLDALLAKKAGHAGALYWKGMLLYDEAEQASKAGNASLATPTFGKAAEAFEGATKADPSRADVWMRLAYTRHYLVASDSANVEKAQAAYLAALDADPSDPSPLRGLQSLLARSEGAYAAIFARLVKEKPKSAAVQFDRALALRKEGKLGEAISAMKAHVAGSRAPYRGWFEIGEMLREKGDDAGAAKAYAESLKAAPQSPVSETAVGYLMLPLEQKGRDAVGSYEDIKKLQKEFETVIALSPKSMGGNNNLAFFLREAHKTPAGKSHADLFEACVEHYVTASEAVGEFSPAYLSIPYAERSGYAQILNDTGIMFDAGETATPDYPKAESYFRRALDWTENGYWDSYGNLRKLLEKQGRTQDALDVAEACAAGIKREDGSPHPDYRAICQGDAERLKKLLPK